MICGKKLHRYKATTSNFGKTIKCSRNPDGLLKSTFYSEPYSAALTYGKQNESTAIEAYRQYMHKDRDVEVEEVGLILYQYRPGLGASLDGIVTDKSSENTRGGLEVKCSNSKTNMSVHEAFFSVVVMNK